MVRRVSGRWKLKQSNGPLVDMNINPYADSDGNGIASFNGVASYSGGSGTLRGRANFDSIEFRVNWGDTTGQYTGRVGLDNRLTGHTFDVNNTESTATWFTPEDEFRDTV